MVAAPGQEVHQGNAVFYLRMWLE